VGLAVPGFDSVVGDEGYACEPAGAVRAFALGVWAQMGAESERARNPAMGKPTLQLMQCMHSTKSGFSIYSCGKACQRTLVR
jgi:hypothetical protein